MHNKVLLPIIVMGALSCYQQVLAEDSTSENQLEYKRYYVTPFVGGMRFDGKRDLDSAFYYGIGAGYHFNKHWSVEAGALWFDTELDGHRHRTIKDCDDDDQPGQDGGGNPGNGGGNPMCHLQLICEPQPDICFPPRPGGPVQCQPQPDICHHQWVCDPPHDGGDPDEEPGEPGEGGQCEPEETISGHDDVDVDGVQYYGSLFYHFEPIGDFYPFITTGLRHMDLTYHNSPRNTEGETLGDVGIGLQRFINDRLSIRATARVLRSFDEKATDVMADVGVVYYFGDRERPAAEPEPEPVVLMDREVRFTLDVKFEFDKTVVRPQFYHDIEVLADAMKKYPDTTVNLEGHTDWRGTDAYNLDLAQRRADAIREVLITKYGIDGSRLTTTSYGESQPIADNNTDYGRSLNRRTVAVIKITEKVPASQAQNETSMDIEGDEMSQ